MASRNGAPKINVTKNYRLFARSTENRPLDLKRHRKLEKSMKEYGFIPAFPLVCCRNDKKELIVKDGQHRLAFAETLGLPVYYIEDETGFDVAAINNTPKTWALRDYALRYAAVGKRHYQEGLDFTSEHGLPIGTAFAMLGGTTSFANIAAQFYDGAFIIKDRNWASLVAATYSPISELSHAVKNARFLDACMAVCRVDGFDHKRLIHGATKCREKLGSYSTRDAYLDVLECLYNFGRHKLVPLKIEAITAMRERSAAKKSRNEATT